MKKFVTSLLAMVMLLSLCTGCGAANSGQISRENARSKNRK